MPQVTLELHSLPQQSMETHLDYRCTQNLSPVASPHLLLHIYHLHHHLSLTELPQTHLEHLGTLQPLPPISFHSPLARLCLNPVVVPVRRISDLLLPAGVFPLDKLRLQMPLLLRMDPLPWVGLCRENSMSSAC